MAQGYQPSWKEIPRAMQRAVRLSLTFSGRSGRYETSVYLWLGGMLANLVNQGLFPIRVVGLGQFEQHWAHWIIDVAYFIPVPALLARRFHDQGRSGWWVALVLALWMAIKILDDAIDRPWWETLIRLGAFIAIMIVTLAPGTVGGNPFGSDPLRESNI